LPRRCGASMAAAFRRR